MATQFPHITPMTPAEQQAAIEDARAALRQGDAAHHRAVLVALYQRLGQKIPLLEQAIAHCVGCGSSREGCDRCRADRRELAALLGY